MRGMTTDAERIGPGTFAAGLATPAAPSASGPDQVSSANAPPSEAELIETARTVHQRSLVLDAHADIVIPATPANFLAADGLSQVDPSKLSAGGVGAVVMSIAVDYGRCTPEAEKRARAVADEKLAAIRKLAADNADSVAIARSSEEILAVRKSGRTALILGFQNARSLEGNVSGLDTFYDAGARVFGLNHVGHNTFSDSSRPFHDPATGIHESDLNNGLSPLGIAAIERINSLGGIVDVSQSSKEATLQAISASKTPVIASHSNVRAISDATRNLSDEEVDRIGQTGGVIHVAPFMAYMVNFSTPEKRQAIEKVRREAGLAVTYLYPYELYWEIKDPAKKTAFTNAITKVLLPATIDMMIDHIDYIVKRIGIDHVGIGTDFNHGSRIQGYNDASQTFAVTLGLVRRGYPADAIRKIWGGNFMRVLRVAESAAEKPNAATTTWTSS